MNRQPAESSQPFYHHVQAERRAEQDAVRIVKVAWLASFVMGRKLPAVRQAAIAALRAVDDEDPRSLVTNLRFIAASSDARTADLANGTSDAVDKTMRG